MAMRKLYWIVGGTLFVFLVGLLFVYIHFRDIKNPPLFSGEKAYSYVLTQMSFGPRIPGSEAHTRMIRWLKQQLEGSHWKVEIQDTVYSNHRIENIIATRGVQNADIILGAHYDSRLLADQDQGPGKNAPVPGANDGASGVAILLELARTLPKNTTPIALVFF